MKLDFVSTFPDVRLSGTIFKQHFQIYVLLYFRAVVPLKSDQLKVAISNKTKWVRSFYAMHRRVHPLAEEGHVYLTFSHFSVYASLINSL